MSTTENIAQVIRDRFVSICAGALLLCFLVWKFTDNFKTTFAELNAPELQNSAVVVFVLACSFITHALFFISFRIVLA